VLAAPGGVDAALAALDPGGTLLVFADAGPIPSEPVYRDELTVVGARSATPSAMRAAARLLPDLPLPSPTVLPLARFAEGLDLYRRREALKVVFTP
jgi:threonine dehydrogenase-like Zn-dependent dehydrogenase